ncbi:hypothetical protein MRX96_036708 [Rhipicephalus microplus]
MSRNRFELIMRMLHFVDNTTIENCEGHPQPHLRKIWPVYQALLEKYQDIVCAGAGHVSVSLLLFKGRLSWKQYMPLKRAVWHKVIFAVRIFKWVYMELCNLYRERNEH